MNETAETITQENTPEWLEARMEWLKILSRLWAALGREPDARQIAVYEQALGFLPVGLLEETINELLLRHRYNNIPTIAEIVEMAKKIAGVGDIRLAGEVWLANHKPYAWKL